MKYTKQERMEIGKEIYTHNISVYAAVSDNYPKPRGLSGIQGLDIKKGEH